MNGLNERLHTGPRALAALRIAVALCWLTLWEVHAAPGLAHGIPTSAPVGSAWMLPFVDPDLAEVARIGVLAGALLGLFGVAARWGFALVTVCGAYLLAIPQLFGPVQHMHHLLWFAALLAASPCADAWSLRQPTPLPGRSLGWGLPTHVAWLMLALIYFFPGVHKLWAQGLGWAGDNLTLLLYWKWTQAWDFVPLTRLDHSPPLLWAGGLAVLAFEVGAPLLLGSKWTRLIFVALALLFHAGTALWFDIDFGVLWVCFVVLLPWNQTEGEAESRDPRPSGIVGTLLLVGIAATGISGTTQGWPFACYPTFSEPHRTSMPFVEIVGVDADGDEHRVPTRALADPSQSQRFVGETWGVLGHYGTVEPAAVDAYVARLRKRLEVQRALGESVEVRMYRAQLSVLPEDIRDGPELTRGEELGRWSR